jgi:hypothetical protein
MLTTVVSSTDMIEPRITTIAIRQMWRSIPDEEGGEEEALMLLRRNDSKQKVSC